MSKIARIEHLHADAGFRRACFLKVATDDGIVGWSEYSEHTGTAGLGAVVAALGELIVGMDALAVERIAAFLRGRTLQAGGGMNQHAIAALTNALLDIKGKALGVPVHSLLGGPFRTRLPLYWSHCGTYRVRHAGLLGLPPLRDFDDVARLGEEVKRRGFKALKTGLLAFDGERFSNFSPAFAHSPGWPELNVDRGVLTTLTRMLAAFRDGRRTRRGADARREFPLQDRRLSRGRARGRAVRSALARARHLRPAGAGGDPQSPRAARSPPARRCSGGAGCGRSSMWRPPTSRSST